MNQDINIILTTAETVATAADFVDGLGRILKGATVTYTFPWKKMGAVSKSTGTAGVAGTVTAVPGALAANTDYTFFITQDMELMFEETAVEQITWTSGDVAPANAAEVCDGWRDVVLAHVNAGRLAITVPAAGAATLILPAASVDNYNLRGVSGPLGTATQTVAPVAPVGRGADLLAEGIVDSFPAVGAAAALPIAGLSYSEYTFELMAPKGSGGFNEQTSDQAVNLKVYADEAAGGWAALDAVIDTIEDGSYTAAELLGSNV
jgi:hypothetical protein